MSASRSSGSSISRGWANSGVNNSAVPITAPHFLTIGFIAGTDLNDEVHVFHTAFRTLHGLVLFCREILKKLKAFIASAQSYCLPLPPGHRFPMEKYRLIPEQLVYEGTLPESAFFVPEPAGDEALLDAHESEYLDDLRNGRLCERTMRKTGFPWSEALVTREEQIMGGTIRAAEIALETGVGMNVAGGTHHAFTNRGEGFCLLNDQAVAAMHLIRHHGIKRIFIADLDVHQGNGTAEICQNVPEIFTFSMHGEKNYPFHKEKSDLDIGLPDGIDDKAYLASMDQYLFPALDAFEPAFIFFQSGVDIMEDDALGRMSVSMAGCRERDTRLLRYAHTNKIPICISMGGGYAPDIRRIVEAHAQTFREVAYLYF